MLPTPVRRRALDYFLGVGGSGRRPVEFADPTGGAGVWAWVRVALENPSTFRFYGPGGGGGLSADPTRGAGVWSSQRVAVENPSTFDWPAATAADP